MASLRRGGSASLFFFEGALPSLHTEALGSALSAQRFRTIETAASEDVSVGWVCSDDPSGDSFPIEHIDLDRAVWLQVRIDQKKLPMRWVAIYRAAAERAAGRKLNGKERKALKEDLMEKLLPRLLPAVQLLDVLLEPGAKRLILFSTAKRAREEFASLFLRTFPGVQLRAANPFEWALRTKITPEQRRYLEEVAPVSWPNAGERRSTEADQSVPDERTRDPLEVEA